MRMGSRRLSRWSSNCSSSKEDEAGEGELAVFRSVPVSAGGDAFACASGGCSDAQMSASMCRTRAGEGPDEQLSAVAVSCERGIEGDEIGVQYALSASLLARIRGHNLHK